ncbi:UMP kinase [Entomospira culicis]|uniref:Uridylate kinase n=1 Tax=Entomospira culicis TaxID=2719989 RepID=A0A968GGV3_9SPIO|nr:UMP kinase [Entomospira culicis]NIZ18592.1 UMP kinase [Entomospira culicis]NIZ68807.1 UMP kinase [Entomospira culicis]WDI37402.1 UMP kinase [Entomospira culicis]WDI39031.1 UMP kinase [Entomospira culicis]
MSMKTLSLGGSLVAPDAVDVEFLQQFHALVTQYLEEDSARKLIIVVGGGAPARLYQGAARSLVKDIDNDALDWIGIQATKLNAQLVKTLFGDLCLEPVVENPEVDTFAKGRILVGAGWKPGFSSDYDAAVLAHRFGSERLVNLSNISYVYSDDPQKNPNAQPLKTMSWQDLQALVGESWLPGSNLPFDPIAAKFSKEHKLTVVVANGKNLENLKAILNEQPFEGTTIK